MLPLWVNSNKKTCSLLFNKKIHENAHSAVIADIHLPATSKDNNTLEEFISEEKKGGSVSGVTIEIDGSTSVDQTSSPGGLFDHMELHGMRKKQRKLSSTQANINKLFPPKKKNTSLLL